MRFKIPLLPLSAIVFYFLVTFFVWTGIFLQPDEAIKILENLYENYGLLGLFVAAFFEGLVYVGLYFAGSFIILFVVLFSDGKFVSFLSISLVVTLAVTLVSFLNYGLGRYVISRRSTVKKADEKDKKISGGLFLSTLHPNSLAFYFFNLGLKRESPWKVVFVPLIMIPYGFLLAFLFYQIKPILTQNADAPYLLLIILLLWFVTAFIIKNKLYKRVK